MEWVFDVPFIGETDRINIRQLTGSSSSAPVIGSCSVPAAYEVGTNRGLIVPPIVARYRPANAFTGDPKRLDLEFTGEAGYSCTVTDDRLPDWGFGDDVYVGVTAASASSSNAIGVAWVSPSGTLAPVELGAVCR